MKLKQKKSSTQQQTSKRSVDEYGYPLYLDDENDPALWVDCPDGFVGLWNKYFDYNDRLKRPTPPTAEAVAKAQFVDKTYVWQNSTRTSKPT